jgi:transposase
MDQIHVRRIAPPERRKLHRMKRQKVNRVNSDHAKVILLSSGSVRNREIARLVGCTPQWVRTIIHRFNRGGLQAIEWYPYFQVPRRPYKFTADLTEEIVTVALSPPQTLIGMTQWSLEKLRGYLISQTAIGSISIEWLRTLLRRCGVRWRRTKTWKESSDPEFWPKLRRIRRLYKSRPGGGRRICVDEFGPLNLQPRHGMCWKGKGKKLDRLRATYHRLQGVRHFLGAYDLEADRLFGMFTPAKTWVEFLGFLKWLRRKYRPTETLHIVMDNYGPHLKGEVLEWAKHHSIKFYLTPTNASWLNRIESQFTAMKKFALEDSDYRSHEELQAAIARYLTWRNGDRDIAINPPPPRRHVCRRAA